MLEAREIAAFKASDQVGKNWGNDPEGQKIKSHHDENEDKSGAAGIRGRSSRRICHGGFSLLDLKNDGKNQRPLGCLLVDVALQIDANLFLDDPPVGFFFSIGFLDGFHNHQSRAND